MLARGLSWGGLCRPSTASPIFKVSGGCSPHLQLLTGEPAGQALRRCRVNYQASAVAATSQPAACTTDLPHGLHSTVTPHDAPWAHGRCAGTSAGEQVLLTRDPGHVPLPHWTLVPSDAALLCSRCFRASGLVLGSKHLWDSDLQQTRGLPRTGAAVESRPDQTLGVITADSPSTHWPVGCQGPDPGSPGASYADGDQPPARLLL